MKKLLLILLVVCTTSYGQSINFKNFKVNEPKNQSFPSWTKFNFEFEIQGDYSQSTHGYHQINLFIYKNSISTANRIAHSYWNREDDYDIIYSSYTKKEWWNYSYKNYTTNEGDKFYLVVEYAGLTKTLSYTYPTAPIGNPDLEIDKFGTTVSSSCSSCNSNLEFHEEFDGSKKYLLAGSSGMININLEIQNDGDANAGSSKLKVYLSENSSIDGNDYIFEDTTVSPINQNSTRTKTFTLFANDLENLNVDPSETSANGTYYIIINLDADNDLDEGTNENNNTYYIPIQYNSDSSITTEISKNESFLSNYSGTNEKFIINIYNFLGQKIKSQEVNSEDEILNDLVPGTYILHYNNNSKKIIIK